MIRSLTKPSETEGLNPLLKKGKYFVALGDESRDFKELFKHLASAGAGRPVDANGFPQGPWTPELLAEAISKIDANHAGVELRTVQLWFQDNDKGISAENIRWLARIFGCDDPEATSAWQAELSVSQSRLIGKRRQRRNIKDLPVALDESLVVQPEVARLQPALVSAQRFSLARQADVIFGKGSFLDLPASVFAGAVALGFASILLGIDDVTYVRDDGVIKQVGFLWAPNWTILFMVFMPMFFAFAVELLVYWKNEGRSLHLDMRGDGNADQGWSKKVEGARYTYWAVFIICVVFAGLFQWVTVRLKPLLEGGSGYAIDWGSIGIERPDIISIGQEAAFTGFAYLYMCLFFYLFFAGLILLYTVAHDFQEIVKMKNAEARFNTISNTAPISRKIVRGIFRCTLLGLLIAICMQIETTYLLTDSESVPKWLADDFLSTLFNGDNFFSTKDYISPTSYTSLIIVIATGVPFFYALFQVGFSDGYKPDLARMTAAVVVLVVAYIFIGKFDGFSVLLGIAMLLAAYGLFDPAFGSRQTTDEGDNDVVS